MAHLRHASSCRPCAGPVPDPAALMTAYAPYVALSAPAQASAGLPRLLIGFAVIEALYAIALELIDLAMGGLPAAAVDAYYGGTTPLGLLAQLASFGFLGLAVVLVLRLGHHRGLGSLLGPPVQVTRDLIRAFAGVLALMLVLEALPPGWDPALIAATRPMGLWLALLVPGLAVLLIQTGAEELLYRGYLQSQLSAWFAHPAVWMILPNMAFALVHWDNGADPVHGAQYVIWAFLFGLAASDLTARSGSLGAAIGFHLANNAYAFLLFGERGGPDSGLALVLFAPGVLSGGGPADMAPLLPPASGADLPGLIAQIATLPFVVELAGVGLIWIAARLAIRR